MMVNTATVTNSGILRHELLSGIRTGRFSKDMILINVNSIALIYVLFSRMHVIASYKIIKLAKAEAKRLSMVPYNIHQVASRICRAVIKLLALHKKLEVLKLKWVS